MAHTIAEIAAALGAEAVGDLSLRVGRAAEPAMAGAGDLALAMDPRYADGIGKGRARAAVVWMKRRLFMGSPVGNGWSDVAAGGPACRGSCNKGASDGGRTGVVPALPWGVLPSGGAACQRGEP